MPNFSVTSCGKVLVFHVKDAGLEYTQLVSTILLIIVNIPSGLLATIGNALVIWTFLKSKVLKGPTYIITGTLSVLDFLVGIFLQPLFIAGVGEPVLKTKNVCAFYYWGFALWAPVFAVGSMTILALIAVDRFIAVIFYLSYTRYVTRFRAVVGIATVLLINLSISVLSYLDQKGPIYFTIISTVTGISYTIMTTCYCSIYYFLKTHGSEVLNRASLEITKTIASASLVCGFCWLPFSIAIPLVSRTTNTNDPKSVLKKMLIYEWLVTLMLGNSALNFAIYYWRNTTMRQEIQLHGKALLGCCFSSCSSAEDSLSGRRRSSTSADTKESPEKNNSRSRSLSTTSLSFKFGTLKRMIMPERISPTLQQV